MESVREVSPQRSTKSLELSDSSVVDKNQLVIQSTLNAPPLVMDKTSVSFKELYKSLSITAKEIVDKINERLKIKLPEGVQSLSPEDVTPEATAERIVTGTTALFDIYAKQNPTLSDEELLTKFMETIRGGIDTGYNYAIGILEGLGAFNFEGVKEGVEMTKRLIEEKLKVYESLKRKELGLDPQEDVAASAIEESSDALLVQGGAGVINVRA